MKERPKRLDGDESREPLPAKVRREIKQVVVEIAEGDDRTLSNTVERLLAESPRVRKRLSQLSLVTV
jgi:replication-associated recombination protein RarA